MDFETAVERSGVNPCHSSTLAVGDTIVSHVKTHDAEPHAKQRTARARPYSMGCQCCPRRPRGRRSARRAASCSSPQPICCRERVPRCGPRERHARPAAKRFGPSDGRFWATALAAELCGAAVRGLRLCCVAGANGAVRGTDTDTELEGARAGSSQCRSAILILLGLGGDECLPVRESCTGSSPRRWRKAGGRRPSRVLTRRNDSPSQIHTVPVFLF